MDFRRGRLIRVHEPRTGDVPLRHASVFVLMAIYAVFTLADLLVDFRSQASVASVAERAALSVPLTFVLENWWALLSHALATYVCGGVVVARDGQRVLWGLVLAEIVRTIAINTTMDVGVYGSGVIIGVYGVVRWPTLRVSGLLTDYETPFWLMLPIFMLYVVAALVLERSGAPAEGHHLVAGLASVVAGVVLGLIGRVVSRSRAPN